MALDHGLIAPRTANRFGIVRIATKKLTKAEKLVQEQMLALLEWACDRPKSWHPIGTLPETQRAAELLASRGVIEIRRPRISIGSSNDSAST